MRKLHFGITMSTGPLIISLTVQFLTIVIFCHFGQAFYSFTEHFTSKLSRMKDKTACKRRHWHQHYIISCISLDKNCIKGKKWQILHLELYHFLNMVMSASILYWCWQYPLYHDAQFNYSILKFKHFETILKYNQMQMFYITTTHTNIALSSLQGNNNTNKK